MTGFRTWRWGVSLRNESTTADVKIDVSNSARAFTVAAMVSSLGGDQVEMLDDRTQRERGDERQRAHQDDDTDEEAHEQRGVSRQRAGPGRDDLLARQRAGDGERRNRQPVTSEEHHDAERGVVEGRVRAQPRKGAAVVVARRGEAVEDLAEAVDAGIRDT